MIYDQANFSIKTRIYIIEAVIQDGIHFRLSFINSFQSNFCFISLELQQRQNKQCLADARKIKRNTLFYAPCQGLVIINYLMFKTALTGLVLVAMGYSKEFSQNDVDGFLKGQNLVSNEATPATFNNKDGRYVLTYDEGNTKQKFVLKPDPQDSLHVVYSEKFTSYALSVQAVSPGPQMIIEFGNPMMENHNGPHPRGPNRRGRPGQGPKRGGKGGCRKMKRELLKKKLFQEIPELEGGQILSVQKLGWQFGKGVELIVLVEKDGRKFAVDTFFRPRRDELNVVEMKEIKEQNPLQIGLQYIVNIFKGMHNQQNNLILGSEGEVERMPLIGSEGERERLPLLGSEGEPEMFGIQGETEQAVEEEEEEEEDKDVEIVEEVEEDGLIMQFGDMVGQDENVETSFGDQQVEENIEEKVQPQLRDQR